MLTSERLCITRDGAGVTIADGTGDSANVMIANIQADNGVIHVIDKVLAARHPPGVPLNRIAKSRPGVGRLFPRGVQ